MRMWAATVINEPVSLYICKTTWLIIIVINGIFFISNFNNSAHFLLLHQYDGILSASLSQCEHHCRQFLHLLSSQWADEGLIRSHRGMLIISTTQQQQQRRHNWYIQHVMHKWSEVIIHCGKQFKIWFNLKMSPWNKSYKIFYTLNILNRTNACYEKLKTVTFIDPP